ncbi:hypothetical protein ACFL4N_03930 [Thermodesulfobacteriota bacterium]
MNDIPRCPKGLRKKGKEFFRKVVREYTFTEAHDLERLFQACGCLDTIGDAEEKVTQYGMFIQDRFNQIKESPAMKIIRDHKMLFCRIIRELNLDVALPGDPRPPRQY